jgi:hypothetical protein
VKPRYNRWETAQDRRREGVDSHWTSTRRSYSNATGKQRLTSRLTAMLDAVLARVADGVVAPVADFRDWQFRGRRGTVARWYAGRAAPGEAARRKQAMPSLPVGRGRQVCLPRRRG